MSPRRPSPPPSMPLATQPPVYSPRNRRLQVALVVIVTMTVCAAVFAAALGPFVRQAPAQARATPVRSTPTPTPSPFPSSSPLPSHATLHIGAASIPSLGGIGLTMHLITFGDLPASVQAMYNGNQPGDIIRVYYTANDQGQATIEAEITPATATLVSTGNSDTTHGIVIHMAPAYLAKLVDNANAKREANTWIVVDPATHAGDVTISALALPNSGKHALAFSTDRPGSGFDGLLFSFNPNPAIYQDAIAPNTPDARYVNHVFGAGSPTAADPYRMLVLGNTPTNESLIAVTPSTGIPNAPQGSVIAHVATGKSIWVATDRNALLVPLTITVADRTMYVPIPIAPGSFPTATQ